MRLYTSLFILLCFILTGIAKAQTPATNYLLNPDRVFDGEKMQEEWQVLVKGDKIAAVGKAL